MAVVAIRYARCHLARAATKVGGGSRIREPRLGSGTGTLHGRAIFDNALANVERAAGFARGRIPIKGNGGVSSAADVLAMRRAGAVCVDLYSAFVYQGWTVARDINLGLLAMFEQAADKDGSMLRSTQLREPQRA